MGDVDEFEIGLVHDRLEFLVAAPVAVGFLGDDAALDQEALENAVDVELGVARIADPERDVFEVAEQGEAIVN